MTVSGKSPWFWAFLVSVCLFLDVTAVIAAGETTAGTMTVKSGNESLTISAPYVEDGTGNNSLLIEWDESGEDWGTLLGSLSLANSPTPYTYTITGLDNGTVYQVRVTWIDDDNAADPTQTLDNLIPVNKLIHSSLSTGSTKWGSSGWGVPGGKYGEFTCQTCHQRNSGNIKRVKKNLVVTDQVARDAGDRFPIEQASGTVNFQGTTGTDSFGDDNRADRSVSDKICEGCHTLTNVHRYNSTSGVADFNHMGANQQDCTSCHAHKNAFWHSSGSGGSGCEDCHAADHVVDSGQADWITFFANGADHTWDSGYTIDTYATCSMCHVTNLLTQHANECSLCHSGATPPRGSFTDWNQTCQQGSCHSSYHPGASDGHDSEYNLNNCSRCHDSNREGWYNDYAWDWIARADFCSECHTLKPDTNPPVTESDLKATYIDDARISLTAFDPWGIQAIYYRLDGGATQTYSSPLTVAAPVSGSQAHTLEFWAKDKSGKVELPNTGNFTIFGDTTPPATTSNARALYGADATIQLTPTDNSTSFPVAATYYKDGASGTVQSGTTVLIPEPVSGSEEHTLYFWSVDHAGNVEDPPKQVTFTIIAGGREHTALHLDQFVGFYADPGASGPRISYKIYIDDVLKTTLTKSVAGLSHVKWNCPETPVSPGSHIDIVVDAWLTSYTGTPDGNAPYTFTLDLPDDAVRLEAAPWDIEMIMYWAPVENDGGSDFAYVEANPATIENIFYLTTVPDTTAPITTSNAVSGEVYGGARTFTLSSTDPAGGTGVESTWWQLDSTAGAWTKGTSVPVTAPVAGTTKAHTLYWYSQDHAGNQEAFKSISFSIENLRTFTTSVPLDEAVWYEAIPDDASGPRVSYTIKLDGTTLGSTFYATAASFPNILFSHAVAQTDITGAGQIDIIVTAGFTNPGSAENNTNSPKTFTLTLPAEATRLIGTSWTGFPKYNFEPNGYYYDNNPPHDEYPYSYVEMPTGTVGNIVYAAPGSLTDTTPPVTTIAPVGGSPYIGSQTFILTPTDAGSGVESTWWQLDASGIWNIGTLVTVAAPASGTVSHTIIWYSRDNVSNQETQQSVTFDMVP